MCVFEEDEEGENDARYHEGALKGEHGRSSMCVSIQPSWQFFVLSSRKKSPRSAVCRSRWPMIDGGARPGELNA